MTKTKNETVFTWSIPHMEVELDVDGKKNVIRIVHWRLMGVNDGFPEEAYGTVNLEDPSDENFKNIDEVKKEEVIAWVIDALNKQTEQGDYVQILKENIEKRIEIKKNPPVITLAYTTASW